MLKLHRCSISDTANDLTITRIKNMTTSTKLICSLFSEKLVCHMVQSGEKLTAAFKIEKQKNNKRS